MKINISQGIYYLGANDRRKHLFENMWPLPQGVAYNSYLITDEKNVLIDTIDTSVANDYIGRIEEILQNHPLDYLVINHMEPDHAGMIGALRHRYPGLQIVGNSKTFKILEAFFGITDKLIEVKDGDVLDLGDHKLQFVMTPWVHWPETMVTYDLKEQILFSGDAFGSFGTLDGCIFDDEINFGFYEDEMRRYFSNIVGKYSNMVQKALVKLRGVPIRMICATHGPIWRSNPAKVIDLYDRWSRHESEKGVIIAYASMYDNTEKMADYIARRIAEQGIKNIRIFDVSKTHVSFLISEIWKYKGVILGSCSYNASMHPMMLQLCHEIEMCDPKYKLLGLFGTYSWNGGGLKTLKTFTEKIDWEQVSDPVEVMGCPTSEKLLCCDELARAMATKLN